MSSVDRNNGATPQNGNHNSSNGGQGRGRGRGRGRARSHRQQSRPNGNDGQWRNLGKEYREWLKERGFAVNAAQFSALSVADKVTLSESYDKSMASTSGIPDHFSPILLDLALRNMEMGWENISQSRTSHESKTVRDSAVRFYGLLGENHCQVLGNGTKHVTNAHIWPHNNRENLPLVDLKETDIDNPKNILRLHGDIEYNFDRFFLTFVPSGNDFILKVLDPTIHTLQIRDVTPPITFQEIDGRPLFFAQGRPWGCLLATHSILSHRKARKDGKLPEDQLSAAEVSANELIEFSLDEAAQFRLGMILNNPTS